MFDEIFNCWYIYKKHIQLKRKYNHQKTALRTTYRNDILCESPNQPNVALGLQARHWHVIIKIGINLKGLCFLSQVYFKIFIIIIFIVSSMK